jgi:hypothetical protein
MKYLMNKFSLLLAASLVVTSTVHADNWDLGQNSVSIGIADVDWTVSPDFHGAKLLLGGRYVFSREAATAYEQPDAEILNTGSIFKTFSMVIQKQIWSTW